jgi:hypothetical protein
MATDPRMLWIHGTTEIPAKYQYGSTPLHRAAGARQPRLLQQVLALKPALDLRGTQNAPLYGGTALHSAAGAGDVVVSLDYCPSLRLKRLSCLSKCIWADSAHSDGIFASGDDLGAGV